MESNNRKNLLLGITGSVASIKLNELIELLISKLNVNICIIPTENALHFVPDFDRYIKNDLNERLNHLKSNSNEPIIFSFIDQDEWSSWSKRTDPVLHIELRKWAHLMLIAPLDANTLAKISNGLCDNLLTCVVRAWDLENIKEKPVIICPAMNTCMYKHPLTRAQLKILTETFGFSLIDSIEKILVCGDSGIGAMANLDTIVEYISNLI
jgi:phosphopantothenoylcysteine decarboxylase